MIDQENPHRTKYGNKPTVVGSQRFASKLEARVYFHLKFKEDHGLIRDLKLQPSVSMSLAGIKCRPDFVYLTQDGSIAYAEAKGCETDRWRVVKKLWRVYGPGTLEVYKASRRGVYLAETIVPDARLKQLVLEE